MARVLLTGYQGETIDQFVKKLKKNDVEFVFDVREIPLSRKSGFSKTHLESALGSAGIEYQHMEELGSPRELRNKLRTYGDYLEFFTEYRKYVKKHGELLKSMLKIINLKHSALLCFEKDCELCHRTILASELQKRNPRLKIIPV